MYQRKKDSPALLEAMTILAASPLVRAAMHQGISFAVDVLKRELDKIDISMNGQSPMRKVLAAKPSTNKRGVKKRGRPPMSTAEKVRLSKWQKARWRKARKIFGPNAKLGDLKGL